jgi:hypothetical protein
MRAIYSGLGEHCFEGQCDRGLYHFERPHQSLKNEGITPAESINATGEVQCHKRLGGLLNHYYRKAA